METSAIAGQLHALGLCLQPIWLQSCLAFLRSSRSDWATLNSQQDVLLEALLGQVLLADLNQCGAGHLPAGIQEWHNKLLQGKYVLQVDEVVDMGAAARDRYMPKAKGCLKLHLTDGKQRVFGIEFRSIPALSWNCQAGTKVVVENVLIKRGVLMLQQENFIALGGQVKSLEGARQKALEVWNLPPSGRSQCDGPRDILGEARAAARGAGAPAAAGAAAVAPAQPTATGSGRPEVSVAPAVPGQVGGVQPAAGGTLYPGGLQPAAGGALHPGARHPGAGGVVFTGGMQPSATGTAAAGPAAAGVAAPGHSAGASGWGLAPGLGMVGAAAGTQGDGVGIANGQGLQHGRIPHAGPSHGGEAAGLQGFWAAGLQGALGGGTSGRPDAGGTQLGHAHAGGGGGLQGVGLKRNMSALGGDAASDDGRGAQGQQQQMCPPSVSPHQQHAALLQQQQQQQQYSFMHQGAPGLGGGSGAGFAGADTCWGGEEDVEQVEEEEQEGGWNSDDELMREFDVGPPALAAAPPRWTGPPRTTSRPPAAGTAAAPRGPTLQSPSAAGAVTGSHLAGQDPSAAAGGVSGSHLAARGPSAAAGGNAGNEPTAQGTTSPAAAAAAVAGTRASGCANATAIGGNAGVNTARAKSRGPSLSPSRRHFSVSPPGGATAGGIGSGAAAASRICSLPLLSSSSEKRRQQDPMLAQRKHELRQQAPPKSKKPLWQEELADPTQEVDSQQEQRHPCLHQQEQHEPLQILLEGLPQLRQPGEAKDAGHQPQQPQRRKSNAQQRLSSRDSGRRRSAEIIELRDSSDDEGDPKEGPQQPPPRQAGHEVQAHPVSCTPNLAASNGHPLPQLPPQPASFPARPQPQQELQQQHPPQLRAHHPALPNQQGCPPPGGTSDPGCNKCVPATTLQQPNTQHLQGSSSSSSCLQPSEQGGPLAQEQLYQHQVRQQHPIKQQGLNKQQTINHFVLLPPPQPNEEALGSMHFCTPPATYEQQLAGGDLPVHELEVWHHETATHGFAATRFPDRHGITAHGITADKATGQAPPLDASLQPPLLVLPQTQVFATPLPVPADINPSAPTTTSSALSLTSRSASSGSGAVGDEGGEVGAGTPRRLGVSLSVASEWESAPVVHLCLLRHYQEKQWEATMALKTLSVLNGQQGPPQFCKAARVRVLGGIYAVMGQKAQVEDGTGLQEMEMSDYMMTHSLGFGIQDADRLRHYNARQLKDNPADHATLAARAQQSSSFLRSFHGLMLIELPCPSSPPATMDLESCSGGWADHGVVLGGSGNYTGAAALVGGIDAKRGLPRLMGLQVLEGGSQGLRSLMAQARANWHSALGSTAQQQSRRS